MAKALHRGKYGEDVGKLFRSSSSECADGPVPIAALPAPTMTMSTLDLAVMPGKQAAPAVPECGDFRRGMCHRGDACKYQHVGNVLQRAKAPLGVAGLALATDAPAAAQNGLPPTATGNNNVGFLVPQDRFWRVIGKQGAGLKQIREACGRPVEAKTESAPEGLAGAQQAACRLTLGGTPEQMCVAFGVAVQRAYSGEPSCTTSVRIPAEWAGRCIGKGGENLRKVRMSCGVQAQVDRDKVQHALTGTEERAVTLQGPTDKLRQALTILLGCAQGQMLQRGPMQRPMLYPRAGQLAAVQQQQQQQQRFWRPKIDLEF